MPRTVAKRSTRVLQQPKCSLVSEEAGRCDLAVGDIVGSPYSHLSDSAESAEKSLRATLLAEPFPGAVAQAVSLPNLREMKALSVGQNQRAAQIRVSGVRARRGWVTSIIAGVEIGGSRPRAGSRRHTSHPRRAATTGHTQRPRSASGIKHQFNDTSGHLRLA